MFYVAVAKSIAEWKTKKEAILNNETADEQMEEDEEENIYAVAPDVDVCSLSLLYLWNSNSGKCKQVNL